jgi:hypothetical protein
MLRDFWTYAKKYANEIVTSARKTRATFAVSPSPASGSSAEQRVALPVRVGPGLAYYGTMLLRSPITVVTWSMTLKISKPAASCSR